jgi:hypothetical protein
MRVFLSAYSGFTLAIPMDAVASMMLYNQETEKTIQYDQKSRCTFISLPWLFNMRDQAVSHGVIMREWNSKENKVVLLTAEVKRDIEIPDKEFFPIPKALGALRFSAIFSGIKFSDNPVLLLNIEQLLQVIQNEQWVTDKITNPPEPQPGPQGVEPSYPRYAVRGSPLEQPLSTAPSEPSPPTPNKVIEEPSIEEPLIEKPPIEELSIEEPSIEEPLIEKLLIEQPSIEEPLIEELSIEEPSIEEPIIEELSIEEPSIEEPLIEELSIKELSIEEPLIEESLIEELLIEEPPIEELLIEEPPIEELSIEEPLIEELLIEEPLISPVDISEPFSLTLEPQTSPQGEVSPLEPHTSPQGEVSPLEPQTSPQGEVSPLDEVLELCEIK